VYPVPVSATPSPWRHPAVAPTTTDPSAGDRHGAAYLETTCDGGGEVVEKPIIITRKRKTLRRVNGEARVFEESYSSVETSPSVGSVASGLAELSLTSLTPTTGSSSSSDTSLSSSTSSTLSKNNRRPPHRTQCKSFIRPDLYTRRLKKHDPVARYHYWKEVWEKEKFPGVESRNALRWQIREQMVQQDLPFFVPQRRPVKVNNYKVPTEKKRSSLRWEIRHQMAAQQ
jgi:hydrolethalus syndrome protein 1